MLIDYLSTLERAESVCSYFNTSVSRVFFEGGAKAYCSVPNFCQSSMYQEQYAVIKACVNLCQMLKIQSFGSFAKTFYDAALGLNDPLHTRDLASFRAAINCLFEGFSMAKDEISRFCAAFDMEEKQRINEAIHTYLENCNYSCVAMSVSAVESRLLKLMCSANPASRPKLEKKTLGELIGEYLEHKTIYKNIVPLKHEHLLGLCNTLRVFSVHPKKEKITNPLASAILNLAVAFLTDEETQPQSPEEGTFDSTETNIN